MSSHVAAWDLLPLLCGCPRRLSRTALVLVPVTFTFLPERRHGPAPRPAWVLWPRLTEGEGGAGFHSELSRGQLGKKRRGFGTVDACSRRKVPCDHGTFFLLALKNCFERI